MSKCVVALSGSDCDDARQGGETKARRHILGDTDRDPHEIDVAIEVVIPADVEQRFEVAEQLIDDAGQELERAVAGLFEGGCVPADVRWLVNRRQLGMYVMPLTISNAELAEDGLRQHPQVLGVRWSDHGFADTAKCRACVEATRSEYFGLDEAGTNQLLYGEVVCDFCDTGHPDD